MAIFNFPNQKYISLKITDQQLSGDNVLLRHSKMYCWAKAKNKLKNAFSDFDYKNDLIRSKETNKN